MSKKPRRRYTVAERALALEILARHDGVVTLDVIRDVREVLGAPDLPKMTIYRWSHNDVTDLKKNEPEVKEKASRALDELFESVARKYTEHALQDGVVGKANAAQLMTAAGIAVDKMRLLRGMPTEIVHSVVEFVEVARRKNLDPLEIMRRAINKMESIGGPG